MFVQEVENGIKNTKVTKLLKFSERISACFLLETSFGKKKKSNVEKENLFVHVQWSFLQQSNWGYNKKKQNVKKDMSWG